jgi:hypothetical protein
MGRHGKEIGAIQIKLDEGEQKAKSELEVQVGVMYPVELRLTGSLQN